MSMKYELFTDGGINKEKKLSCGSAILLQNNNGNISLKSSAVKICSNSTNNEGELYGILKGIELVDGNNNIPYTLYSDSEYSVNTLRSWIFNWFKSYTETRENSIMIPCMKTGGGTDVKNLELICTIINMIVDKRVNIRFKNVRGHMSVNSQNDISTQMEYYNSKNYDKIDFNKAKDICKGNNTADQMCTNYINKFSNGTLCGGRSKHNIIFYDNGTLVDIRHPNDDVKAEASIRYPKYIMLNKAIMTMYAGLIGLKTGGVKNNENKNFRSR